MIRILLRLMVCAGLCASAAKAADLENVKTYGAKGDGVTDDTAAINAAFAHARARTAAAEGFGFNIAKIVFPQGEYLVTAPLDATGFIYAGLTIDGGGAIIYAKVAGGIVLDALGDRYLKINDLTIHGDATIVAKIGLQIGRVALGRSADNHSFHNVMIDGSFTQAALHDFAAETTLFDHTILGNDNKSAHAYAITLDGLNHWRTTSSFVKETAPVDHPESFDEQTFVNCIFYGGAGGAPIWMAGTHGLVMIESYVASKSGTGAILYSGAGSTFEDVNINAHFETGSLRDIFLITGPNPTPWFGGFAYKDHDSFAARSIFRQDAGIRGVTISDADIVVPDFPNGAPEVFSGAGVSASWTVDGRVQIPSARNWHPFSGWSGCLIEGTTRACTAASLTAKTFRMTGDVHLSRRTITRGLTDTVTDADTVVAWNSAAAGAKVSRIPACSPETDGVMMMETDERGDAGTNPIVVIAPKSTIDGARTYSIDTTRGSVTLTCDGSVGNWMVTTRR